MARYEEHLGKHLAYQAHLRNREELAEADYYYSEEKTPRRTYLTLGLLGAGGVAGVLMFRHGLLSGLLSRGAALLGRVTTDGPLSALSRGLYTWSREARPGLRARLEFGGLGGLRDWWREEIGSLRQHIAVAGEELRNWRATWRPSALETSINEMEVVLRNARQHWEETFGAQRFAGEIEARLRELRDLALGAIREHYHVPAEEMATITRRFGVRPATVEELGQRDLVSADLLAFARQNQLLGLVADPHVLINPRTGAVHDLRPFVQGLLRQVRGFERHFALPVVRFNPLSLFYVEEIAGLERKPLIYSFVRDTVQPTATGSTKPARNLVYIAGHVYDLGGAAGPAVRRLTSHPGQLLNARRYLAKQHIRSLYGIPATTYVERQGKWAGRYARLMRRLGLGFQDIAEYAGEDAVGLHELFSKGVAERLWDRLGPYAQKFSAGNQPFGLDERWLFIQKARLDPAGFWRQLTAHRGRPQDVSPLTLGPYVFFSRLNTMLGTAGLALPIEDTASAWSIYGNLLLKRLLPITAVPFAWHYLNYELQNLTGWRPEEALADAYAGATVEAAALADRLGLTERLKKARQLFPGGEQLSGLPGVGLLTIWMGKSAEEMQEYWERGEEPVRKGRYWPLGSGAFTGGRIQYYRPNWVRRLKARPEYTDVLYGSETEYFANAPFPTPRFPLCVLPGQLIVLDDSVVAIEDVPTGAKTLNYRNQVSKVIATLARPANEMANKITVKGKPAFPLMVTSNHPVYIIRPHEVYARVFHRPHLSCENVMRWLRTLSEEELLRCARWVSAEEVQEGDLVVSPRLTFGTLNQIDLATVRSWTAVTDQWVYPFMSQEVAEAVEAFEAGKLPISTGDKRRDYRIREKARKRLRTNSTLRYPRFIPLSTELATVIGLYLAEGHWSKSNDSGSQLHFTLGAHESQLVARLKDAIEAVAGREACVVVSKGNGNSLKVTVHVSWLADALTVWCGKGAANKHLPEWFFEAPEWFARTVILFYIMGDGWVIPSGPSLAVKTVSRTLAAQAVVAAEALGFAASVKMSNGGKVTTIEGRKYVTRDSYTVVFPTTVDRSAIVREHFVFRKVIKNEQFYYTGYVYDLEVEHGESFTTIAGIVHNSPLRHFLTDPYHWEHKHYVDRPYPITGDIPELAEFPLLGPILGWLGRIFKPPMKMHPEFWEWVEAGVIPQPEGYPERYVNDAYRKQKTQPWFVIEGLMRDIDSVRGRQAAAAQAAVQIPPGQWGIPTIGAPYAAAGEGRGTAVVAVIDTGVDVDHPALRGRLLPGYNAVTGTEDVADEYGHGTHVAGIISGVTAAAGRRGYDVKILPIKASDKEGRFSPEAINRAIEYAINWRGPNGEQVSVINMSLGSPMVHAGEQEAIQKAYEAGILPVIAAGNESLELHVGAPAIWPEALAVGALKKPVKEGEEPKLAPYSNRGIGLDVTAPGSEIPSAYPDDTYETLSGTSMAAPHVAAAIALLRAAHPDLPLGAIRYIIQATAADLGKGGRDSQYGAGGLDLGLADAILRRIDKRERARLIAAAELEDQRIAAQRAVLLNYIRNRQANQDVYYVNQKIVDQYGRTVKSEQSAEMAARALLENIKEFAGFYGFVPDIIYESQYRRIPRLATSRALTSYRRRWWEKELGGLGGDINEVLRRFIGKKEFWAEYFNPLPNQMPSWLPGPEYMVDYHTGDPFLKHPGGEYRLPGPGYEALHPMPLVEAIRKNPVLQYQLALLFGTGNPLEYYDPFNRFRILANVAPWSEEYKQYSRLMEEIDLTPEQREEVKEIRARVRALKKPLRVYPYRFLHKHLQRETVTVERVVDANTFYVKEYPDHPVRLAGIHVPTGKDDETAQKAAEFLARHIYPGAKVTIGYDRERKIADDTYQTIRAVIYSGNINLNLALLHQGLATEKETDYSAAGIAARFTPEALLAGKLWEKFAHLDTFLHTKFLAVPSPAEDWWRREVYGKRLQRWERAGRDYLIPTYQSFIMRHPLIATASGMVVGYLFGRTSYGRIIGTAIGGLLVGGGAIYRALHEFFTGERWIPARRRKEWALEEYIDFLKYIKYARLFAYEARAALEEEHFDVVAYLAGERRRQEERRKRTEELAAAKRRLHKEGERADAAQIARELGVTIPEPAEGKEETPARRLLRAINAELKALAARQPEPALPPRAARALEFYRQMKSTMYGYEPGEPLGNFLAALPKKERRYFNYLAEAPEEEWRKVKDVLPPWMLYGLAPARGEAPPPKPELAEYFEHHFLPGPDWPGWRADVSLQDVRVKLVRHEGMDVAEFDIWPDDEARAAMVVVPAPRAFRPAEHGRRLREKLAELLSGRGITDLDVLVEPADNGGIDIDVEVEEDRSGEIAAYLNKDPRLLVR